MKLEGRSTHTPVVAVAPRTHHRGPEVFHRAVEVLKAKHHVTDSVAYTMLVEAAVDQRTTVRDAAAGIIRASLANC